jgi:hypothetical protein
MIHGSPILEQSNVFRRIESTSEWPPLKFQPRRRSRKCVSGTVIRHIGSFPLLTGCDQSHIPDYPFGVRVAAGADQKSVPNVFATTCG